MLRLAVILMLIVLSSACSRTEFAYRNADTLLEYYAWKIVRINDVQEDRWQPVLQSVLQHHREEELPLVIAYLDLAGRIVREKDNKLGAECLVDGALFLYQRHARLAVDLAVPVLVDLDATQIKHLAEYMAQDYKDDVKRYLNPDLVKRKAAREKRFLDEIESWTGKLNDSQRKLVKDAVERIPEMSESWLVDRAQQRDTLLAILKAGTNTEALRKFLNERWVNREGGSAEARKLRHIAKHEFIVLMDGLASTLISRQRAKIEDRLGDLRTDLIPFLPSQQPPGDLEIVPACANVPA